MLEISDLEGKGITIYVAITKMLIYCVVSAQLKLHLYFSHLQKKSFLVTAQMIDTHHEKTCLQEVYKLDCAT